MLGECWLILRTSHKTRRKLLQAVRLSALAHPQPDYISPQVLSLTGNLCFSLLSWRAWTDRAVRLSALLHPQPDYISVQVYTVSYPGNLCFSLLSWRAWTRVVDRGTTQYHVLHQRPRCLAWVTFLHPRFCHGKWRSYRMILPRGAGDDRRQLLPGLYTPVAYD